MVINRIASIRLDAKPMHMYKCVCVSIDIAGTKSGTPKSSPHNASLIAAEQQRTISTKSHCADFAHSFIRGACKFAIGH